MSKKIYFYWTIDEGGAITPSRNITISNGAQYSSRRENYPAPLRRPKNSGSLIFCNLQNKSEGHLSCQTLHATPWHTIHCECNVAFSFTSVASAVRVHNTLPVCAQIMSIFLVDEWFYLCDVPCPHVASVCCHPRDFRSSRLVCHLFDLHLRKQ